MKGSTNRAMMLQNVVAKTFEGQELSEDIIGEPRRRNEKAKNCRTHFAGRRNRGSRLGRRRRLPLRRLDSTLSQPRWQRCSPRVTRRALRFVAWPAHLRSLVGLLAE